MNKIICSNARQLQDAVINGLPDDSEIILSDAIYELDRPIELKNLSNIYICGNGARLCGTVTVNAAFEPDGNGRMVSSLPAGLRPEGLYAGERAYVLCRYPNYDSDALLGGTAADTLSGTRISRWKNPAGGYIRALHIKEWGGNDYIIDGKNEDGTLKLRWVGDNNRGNEYRADTAVAENIVEELDAPGEWFYDTSDGKLYVIPYDGDDLNFLRVRVALSPDIFSIHNCSKVSVSDVHFCMTARTMFTRPYEKLTRSDWAVVRDGAIFIENSDNINISCSSFTEIGGNCICISGRNRDINVADCTFADCGASGVLVLGDPSCRRDPSTWEEHKTEIADFIPGPKNNLYPQDITVERCTFENLGVFEKQSSPISISMSRRVNVLHCTMHRLPRAGINICDGCFGGHNIRDNVIYDTVRETGDHGPFNSWGRDRFWSYKGYDTNGGKGKEKASAALIDAVDTTYIIHNYIRGTRGFGIDLDDGSTNYIIERNYCVGVGIKLREGFHREVRGNYIKNAPLDLHVFYADNGDIIEKNVVISNAPLSVIMLNEGHTTRIENNLFVGADENILSNPILGAGNITSSVENLSLIGFEPIEISFGSPGTHLPNDEDTVC